MAVQQRVPRESHMRPTATRAKMPACAEANGDGDGIVPMPARWARISPDDLGHIRRLVANGLGAALGEPTPFLFAESTDQGPWVRRTSDGRIEGDGLDPFAHDYAALYFEAHARRAGIISPMRGWPLDFVDARDALERLDEPRAFSMLMSFLREKGRSTDPSADAQVALLLGKALGRAAERAAVIAARGPGRSPFLARVFDVEWEPALASMPSTTDGVYWIVRRSSAYMSFDHDMVRLLHGPHNVHGRAPRMALCASVSVGAPCDASRNGWSSERMNTTGMCPDITRMMMPFVLPFLAAIAMPADTLDSRGPFSPLPAGLAQVRAALVPVPSVLSVDRSIVRAIRYGQNRDTATTLEQSTLHVACLTEAELVLAVRLMTGQVTARRNVIQTFRSRTVPSLMAMAASACARCPPKGSVPDEVVAFAAPHIRDRIWASDALPSGRIPDGAHLVALAEQGGHTLSDVGRKFPELL